MKDDSRRGFLKTLGKLGAAVGLTAAVASTSEAKIPTTPKAKIDLASNSHTTIRTGQPHFEFGFSGFRNTDPLADMEQLQKDVDLVTNQLLDSTSLRLHPPMAVPQYVYDFINKRHIMENLDPYKWGDVFELTWVDWHSTDARFATKRAYWEARVKQPYRGIFKESVYQNSVELPMEYLIMRVNDRKPIMDHAKHRCYDELVHDLRCAIQTVVATDKKLNAPKADNKSSFDLLSDDARKTITG